MLEEGTSILISDVDTVWQRYIDAETVFSDADVYHSYGKKNRNHVRVRMYTHIILSLTCT